MRNCPVFHAFPAAGVSRAWDKNYKVILQVKTVASGGQATICNQGLSRQAGLRPETSALMVLLGRWRLNAGERGEVWCRPAPRGNCVRRSGIWGICPPLLTKYKLFNPVLSEVNRAGAAGQGGKTEKEMPDHHSPVVYGWLVEQNRGKRLSQLFFPMIALEVRQSAC